MHIPPNSHITILGAGHVATVFSALFLRAGHIIDGIWSRNPDHAAQLANVCKTTCIPAIELIPAASHFILIAVKDDAIAEVAAKITNHNGIVLHTAGAVSKRIIAPVAKHYGVMYPLQTLRKEMPLQSGLPLLIDGDCDETIVQIRNLASSISEIVSVTGDEERRKLHLAAVIVSNFTNHLYQLAYEWCRESQIPFHLLLPLIREMAVRQSGAAPSLLQTGPASRGDETTIQLHLKELGGHPVLRQVYQLMSDDLLARMRKNDELRTHN